MNDEDIAKLAARLTESLATKDDVKGLQSDIKRLEEKTDTILQFVETVDEAVDDHEKRLRKIESIPVIAHQIKQ